MQTKSSVNSPSGISVFRAKRPSSLQCQYDEGRDVDAPNCAFDQLTLRVYRSTLVITIIISIIIQYALISVTLNICRGTLHSQFSSLRPIILNQ